MLWRVDIGYLIHLTQLTHNIRDMKGKTVEILSTIGIIIVIATLILINILAPCWLWKFSAIKDVPARCVINPQ